MTIVIVEIYRIVMRLISLSLGNQVKRLRNGGKLAAYRSASTNSKQIYLIIELPLKFSFDAKFSQRDYVFKIFFWLLQSVEFILTHNLLKVAEDACGVLEELTKCFRILPNCLKLFFVLNYRSYFGRRVSRSKCN